MDKRLILAVAGSGKTTFIVNSLMEGKRTLIVTYTITGCESLKKKISEHFCGHWPNGVYVMSYFSFLFDFCYKPFLSDDIKAKGLFFELNGNKWFTREEMPYYMTPSGYLYSNRLALLLEERNVVKDIQNRIENFFDEFIIDEVQDIAGRDFNFLERIMKTNVSMLFVGDFFQHTFSTSNDGNVNQNLFSDKSEYVKRFTSNGFKFDDTLLSGSWRCSSDVCGFISSKLQIEIHSAGKGSGVLKFVTEDNEIKEIMCNDSIVKLHFRGSHSFKGNHRNWGEVKGDDSFEDVCVLLNKETMEKYRQDNLHKLKPMTKNKFYVALTRAHGNCYLVEDI